MNHAGCLYHQRKKLIRALFLQVTDLLYQICNAGAFDANAATDSHPRFDLLFKVTGCKI